MEWRSPPQKLTLPMDEVQIWRADLQAMAEAIDYYLLLSPDEQARAHRFRFPKDRNRFVTARGILRSILSRYLAVPPQDLQFGYSPTGKPSLAYPKVEPPFCFNLSHSEQLALYAVARKREVGIDVEKICLEHDCEGIAERFFAASEQAALNQLSSERRHQGFFNGWTRKEAFLKATGQGLTIPLDQLVVSLTPNVPAQILHTDWNPAEVSRWSIQALEAGVGYAAAVVAAGQGWQTVTWQFDPAPLPN